MTCHICSKFIQNNYKDNFKFSEKTSAYIAGAVYDVSMLFSPFMGTIVASLPVYWLLKGSFTVFRMLKYLWTKVSI